jgi:hypothetical protein
MKKLVWLVLLLVCQVGLGQEDLEDKKQIQQVMDRQVIAWNNYDLEGFMEGYWKSDSLKFYGRRGITYGWQQTLDNYKKGYPDKSYAGQLRFEIEDATAIEANSYYVMGRFFLKREVGDAEGIFMLIFKRIDGQWKIVADMSCG